MYFSMHDFTVHHVERIESTNTQLLQWSATRNCHRIALVADEQTAGRGQRGRRWQAAPGEALLCSVAWQFPRNCALDGMSLAVGVMVAEALAIAAPPRAASELQLKWPNDLLLNGTHKLGGILIETVASVHATRTAVLGIGINLKTPVLAPTTHGLPPIGFDDSQGVSPQRDQLLDSILASLNTGLALFERDGFAAFQQRWWARCAYLRQTVCARLPSGESITGRIQAVTERGALVIESQLGSHTLISGEVSLRVASA
jgi:BirA family transcriptional regulator, biotin operon repressor / biotin---[acetyl-CoA-carboxylase] ligase